MIFSITSNSTNINFHAGIVKYPRKQLDELFLPLLENKNLTKKQFYAASGIPYKIANNWFKNTFGKSIGKFFLDRKHEILRREVMERLESGMSESEISQEYFKNDRTSHNKLRALGLLSSQKDIRRLLDEKMPGFLEAGYTLKQCGKELKVSKGTIQSWMKEHKNQGIMDYRRKNHISLAHDYDKTHPGLREEMADFFRKGGTIIGAAEKFKMSVASVRAWLKRFDIKTERQKMYDSLAEQLDDFLKYKMSLLAMAYKTGLSEISISRYIKRVTGKGYREIKKQ